MKSEIKKIILTRDEDTLKGFVVIKTNKIEKYGYDGLSNDEILNKYSEVIEELRSQFKEQVKDLNDQDAVNKLYKLGKLEYNKDKFITGITCYNTEDSKTEKFEIQYTDSKEEIKLEDCFDEEDFSIKMENKIIEMSKFYNIKVDKSADLTDEVLKKLINLGLLKEKQIVKTKEKEKLDDEVIEDLEEDFSETLKTNKIKNFVVRHPFVSMLASGAMVLLVTTLPGQFKKNNQTKEAVTLAPSKVIEIKDPIVILEPTNTPEATPKATVTTWFAEEQYFENLETVPPVAKINDIVEDEFFKEIYFDGEENIFTDYEDPENNLLLMRGVNSSNGYVYFDSSLEEMNEIRNLNMACIADNIQSDIELDNDGMYIYYENMFNDFDLRDKAYVKYFSMIGNVIIKHAYINKNAKGVQDFAKISGVEVLKLIGDDVPLHVYLYGYEDYIRFSELSREAQETVLNIAWANNFVLNGDKEAYKTDEQLYNWDEDTIDEIPYNEMRYTKADIGNLIISKADELNMIR